MIITTTKNSDDNFFKITSLTSPGFSRKNFMSSQLPRMGWWVQQLMQRSSWRERYSRKSVSKRPDICFSGRQGRAISGNCSVKRWLSHTKLLQRRSTLFPVLSEVSLYVVNFLMPPAFFSQTVRVMFAGGRFAFHLQSVYNGKKINKQTTTQSKILVILN